MQHVKGFKFMGESKIIFRGEFKHDFPVYCCEFILYYKYELCDLCAGRNIHKWRRNFYENNSIDFRHVCGELYPEILFFRSLDEQLKPRLKFFNYKDCMLVKSYKNKKILQTIFLCMKIPIELIFVILSFIRTVDLGNEL